MRTRAFFAGMMLAAALLPMLIEAVHHPTLPQSADDDLPWPESFEGRMLVRLPLAAADQRFADRFPGRLGRFTDGERILILRVVQEPTRMLHSAAVCFRGLGYQVEAPHAMKDAGGIIWGCFGAERDGGSFTVCERIYDSRGGAWNDVSSWYWAAILGRTEGPWYAISVVSRR